MVSNNIALCSKSWQNTGTVLKQCMIMQRWIFPFMWFDSENCLNILNVDFGSASILDSGDGAGQGLWVICLTAACPLLLFVGGIPSVGHKPWCILVHFRLLLAYILLNTCKGTIKMEREKSRKEVGDMRDRERREAKREGERQSERTKQKGNPLRSPMLAVVFEFVWSTARGGKISNETAAQHTSITGRSGDTCWERKQGKDKKHIQEDHVSGFYQQRDSHRSPLLPHSSTGGEAISCNRQLHRRNVWVLRLSEYYGIKKCIPIDAVLLGRSAGSSVTASLCLLRITGAGATKGGGGGGIRILKGERRQYLHHKRFMKNNTWRKLHLLTDLSTAFSSPTLEAGSADSWWAGPSGERLVGWNRKIKNT